MPLYREKPPIVEAAQVVRMADEVDDKGELAVTLNDGTTRAASAWMLQRMPGGRPKVGDYWIGHQNGHCYFMAKDAFEGRYELLPP